MVASEASLAKRYLFDTERSEIWLLPLRLASTVKNILCDS